MLPSINRSRFQAELTQEPKSVHVQALSSAIATLGAHVNPDLAFAVDACYRQTRKLLDMCERQENGAILTNINTLQAYILLGMFEARRPNFALAWITLGRVIRLAQIMCLDKAPLQSATDAHVGVFTPLSPALEPAEIEERHRTFWQLYVLDGLASMRTCSAPAFDGHHVSKRMHLS